MSYLSWIYAVCKIQLFPFLAYFKSIKFKFIHPFMKHYLQCASIACSDFKHSIFVVEVDIPTITGNGCG